MKYMTAPIFCALALALLLGVSCKPDSGAEGPYTYSYPPVTYTNNASWPLTVTNGAGETLTLEREDSLTLSAGPRGRADIIGVRPPYAAWIQNNGDIYDIRFVDRERFDLEIRNYSPAALAITEKNGYLDPPSLAVPAAGRAAGRLYTDKPVFALTGSPVWKLRYVDGTCIVGIDPPAGDWWEHDYP